MNAGVDILLAPVSPHSDEGIAAFDKYVDDLTAMVAGGDVTQYGPNIPAAVYLALSQEESPTGKLPVNVPKLTADYTYSDEILYPFGFGLQYEKQ